MSYQVVAGISNWVGVLHKSHIENHRLRNGALRKTPLNNMNHELSWLVQVPGSNENKITDGDLLLPSSSGAGCNRVVSWEAWYSIITSGCLFHTHFKGAQLSYHEPPQFRGINIQKMLKSSTTNPRHPVIPAEVWCFRYVFGAQIPSQDQGKFQGPPKMRPPYGKLPILFPYHSHISRDSYG